jgi:diguanylate cyclase (GGDEF)-like protein
VLAAVCLDRRWHSHNVNKARLTIGEAAARVSQGVKGAPSTLVILHEYRGRADAMAAPSRSKLRLALGIVIPAFLVLAGAVLAVLVSLDEMASIVNRAEAEFTRNSAEAAIHSAKRHMAETVGDYAQWDDATRNLYGAPDPTFVDENLVGSTADPVLFDTAYLIDAAGNDILGFRLGEPADTSSIEAFGPSLARMISELPTDARTFDARAGLVSGAFGLALVAVAPVVPFSADVPVTEGEPRFLAIGRVLDADAVHRLGEDYVIDRLTLANPSVGSDNGIGLADYEGNIIAALTWTPRQPGTAAQSRVGAIALSMLALLAVLVVLLVGLSVRGLFRLQDKERDARHAATHDLLTGLCNRAALVARLEAVVRDMRYGGPPVAVVYLDLDGFKEVNEAYGHAVGDRLLITAAKAFGRLCGDRLLVRVGGDEFAVVVIEPDATIVAVEIGQRFVDFFEERLEVDGRLVSLSTSVGVVGAGTSEIDVEELLRRADVAMYRAKQLGRDRICVFEPALDAARTYRMRIAEELREALVAGSLTLAYQPIFDARTGRIVTAEALLRWPRASGEDISTAEFIAIAEESGLIEEIGAWTIGRACQDALAWPDIRVAVNVSPAQFRNPDFAAVVASALREQNLPPNRLEIEVTENFFIAHPEQAQVVLGDLHRLGVVLALDDFGTGYSSIGYLRRFAFDKLKIDRALVAGIDTDRQAQQLVHATVLIGRALGLTVTAEGVESEAEAFVLRAAGCHEFQGFHFARPEPAWALTARLAAEGQLAETG